MKKIIQTLFVTLMTISLSGCFGGDSTTDTTNTANPDLTTYQAGNFSILIPKEWEIIEPKDFSSKVASNTLIAFRNNIKNDIYTANINIIANDRLSEKTSKEHGQEVINSEKVTVIQYKELIREILSLKNSGNTDEAEFIVFEGKTAADQDLVRYVQTFLAKDDKVYIVTGSYRATEDEKTVQLIQQAIKNFEIK